MSTENSELDLRISFSVADDVPYKIIDVVNRLVSNEKDDSTLMSVDGATYILPPNCKFFLSDVAYFCKYFVQRIGNLFIFRTLE